MKTDRLETNPGREYAGIGASLGGGWFAPRSLWEKPGHSSRFEDISTPWGASSKPQKLFSHSNNYWNCVSSRNTGLVAPEAVRSSLGDTGSEQSGHLGSHVYVYIKWHKCLITIPKGGVRSDFSLHCSLRAMTRSEDMNSDDLDASLHSATHSWVSGFGQLPRGASVYSSVEWGKWFCYILGAPTGN